MSIAHTVLQALMRAQVSTDILIHTMTSLSSKVTRRIYALFASRAFFILFTVLFALGTSWVILASIYPMAFDEEFHYGLIQIYATSLLPYGIVHTPDMAQYGSATGDPSYLFHYIMSFPYRLLDVLDISDTFILIILRFINMLFVVASLFVFRKALIEASIRPLAANLSLLLYCFIPVLTMLAAQINYDTLLLLVISLSSLALVRITNSVASKSSVPARDTYILMILLLIGMSIKYAFLPIALGMVLWIIGCIVWLYVKKKKTVRSQASRFIESTKRLTARAKWVLAALGLISVFFASHYITNTVQYGHPIPDCAAVFDEQACTAYGPWNRNRNYVNNLSESFTPLSFPVYMATEWVPGMTERLTFALAGKTNDFQTKQPLPIVLIGLVMFTVVGLSCLLGRIALKRASLSSFMWMTLLISAVYVGVLCLQLYGEYARTGQPVAINGRYLLLVLPLLGAVLLDSILWAFRKAPLPIKMSVLLLSLTLMIFGGAGVSTYIIQSESHWFWQGWGQQSHATLQAIFRALTIRWQLFD